MKKGDKVLFTQYVIAHTDSKGKRTLFINQIIPTEGILLGYSFLRTGKVEWDSDGFGYLFLPKDHKVWVVEPLTHGDRYINPYRVLEQDLRKVGEE